jgi:hypothetical protein
MRLLLLVMLVGCTSESDATTVVDAACTRTSATVLDASAELDATLETKDTVIVEVTFDAVGTSTANVMEQWSCGAWTQYTNNDSVIGCTRRTDQPATAHITMTHHEQLADGVFPSPLQVAIGGKLLGKAVTSTMITTCP